MSLRSVILTLRRFLPHRRMWEFFSGLLRHKIPIRLVDAGTEMLYLDVSIGAKASNNSLDRLHAPMWKRLLQLLKFLHNVRFPVDDEISVPLAQPRHVYEMVEQDSLVQSDACSYFGVIPSSHAHTSPLVTLRSAGRSRSPPSLLRNPKDVAARNLHTLRHVLGFGIHIEKVRLRPMTAQVLQRFLLELPQGVDGIVREVAGLS